MTDRLRAAILGTRHPHVFPRIELLRDHPAIDLTGFVEPDDGIATRLTERTGLPRLSPDRLGPVDLAVVEGLDPEIPEVTDLALSTGVRGVLVEKPGAATPQDCYAMASRLAAAGVVVDIGYELHYSDVAQWCREIVDGAVLGQITGSRFHGGCPSGAGAELWQSIPDDLGGLVYTEGSHLLEIVYDLFGMPSSISASVRRLPQGAPVDAFAYKPDLFSAPADGVELAIGTLTHEDIGTALLEYPTQTVTLDLTAWEPTPWCTQWWIECYGTNGSLVAVPEPAELRLTLRSPRGRFPAGETVLRTPPTPGRSGLAISYARQLDSVIRRVAGQPADTRCGLGHAVGVMQMLEAIYRSARDRVWTTPPAIDLDEAARTR
jgi:predicted dehydrogenase